MNCVLCSSENFKLEHKGIRDFEYESPGLYSYWKCLKCGLLNIDPVPDQTRLAEAYPKSYHAYHSHGSHVTRFLKNFYWSRKASRYEKFLPDKNSNILDAGCSFGDLLKELTNRGYTRLKGLDINGEIVEKAQNRGLDVIQGDMKSGIFPKDFFNIVIMDNYIEHVYDPLDTLRMFNSILVSGGLLVGETPNTDSLDFNVFGKYWGGYHAPRHLYLFNIHNLKLLADKAGFKVKRISNIIQPAHWVLSVQNRIQDSPFATALKNGRSLYFPFLLLAFFPLNLFQWMSSKTSSVEFVFEKI